MKLVAIEGLDASGKSTQGIKLYKYLQTQEKAVYLRVHPSTDNFFGINAKKFLYSKGKSAHVASALFYMLDVIRSLLLYSWRRFDYLLFVRYLMGTAYLPAPLHRIAYYFFSRIVPTPTCVFFLDVSPEVAHRRIQQTRTKQEMFETWDKLNQIRQKARELALVGKWVIINANKPAKYVENRIKQLL
ncbi:MAG: thymidylate kinase [Candidatus Hodarchaeota archaeon]